MDLRVLLDLGRCYVSISRLPDLLSLITLGVLVVLGSPGSGCTTLLKTLSNQTSEYHSISPNSLQFPPFSPQEIQSHYRGDLSYSPEDDIHFPTLSVDQTMEFAVGSRMAKSSARPGLQEGGLSRKEFVRYATDAIQSVFGLSHAGKTKVGDSAIRGVSGGEKKRVSIAESVASRGLISCWDKYVSLPFLFSVNLIIFSVQQEV